MHFHIERFDLAFQHRAAAIVQLHRHQARRKFDHMRVQSQILQRFGRFQTQQAAADYHADFGFGRRDRHCLQIFNSAVHQTLRSFMAGHRRHEGIGTGRQYQFVVSDDYAIGGGHLLALPVDTGHPIA